VWGARARIVPVVAWSLSQIGKTDKNVDFSIGHIYVIRDQLTKTSIFSH
jgi:hypothetical protein